MFVPRSQDGLSSQGPSVYNQSAQLSILAYRISTHIRPLRAVFCFQDIPQHVHARLRFDRDTCMHPHLVYVSNHLLWIRLSCSIFVTWLARCNRCHGSFVVETVEVASCIFEIFHPFHWLSTLFSSFPHPDGGGSEDPQSVLCHCRGGKNICHTHLGNHHVAVKRPSTT